MFKVITTDPAKPEYLLMCDNRNCGFTARGTCDLTDNEAVAITQTAFFNSCIQDGWAIGWDAQVCPDHAMHLNARASTPTPEKKLVKPANLYEIGNLSKSKSKPS